MMEKTLLAANSVEKTVYIAWRQIPPIQSFAAS